MGDDISLLFGLFRKLWFFSIMSTLSSGLAILLHCRNIMRLKHLWQILTLNSDFFILPDENAYRILIILLIVISASISEALGQSAVLFINRVKAHRFVASILSSALIYFFNFFFWVLSISFIVRVILKIEIVNSYQIFFIVAIAYSPRLLGFLVFSPLIGSVINSLLRIWSVLVLHTALVAMLGLEKSEAVYIVVSGFIVTQLIRHSFGHPLIAWARAITKKASGVDFQLRPDALANELDPELRSLEQRRKNNA